MVIIAALQWAAMEHEKISKLLAAAHDMKGAAARAAFAGECARLADVMNRGH